MPSPRTVGGTLPSIAGGAVARAIRARGIVKSFEAGIPGCSAIARALGGADLDILPGEHVALNGLAGSGKSTLLLILAGLLRPDRGSVQWLSHTGESLREPRALEYLPSWRSGHGLESLRRAVAAMPGLLLVDDIFSGLDAVSRREARVLIRDLRTAHVTVVLASRHDPSVVSLCSRVIVLRAGRVDGRANR